MEVNFVLVQFNKSNENKKIIGVFKHYKDLKNYIENNKEKLFGNQFEIWQTQTIKNKFQI